MCLLQKKFYLIANNKLLFSFSKLYIFVILLKLMLTVNI